jgi:hypothetical protein
MVEKPVRVYADTSVYGGVFDEEFATASRLFFEEVRAVNFQLMVSPVVESEMRDAPGEVQQLFAEMLSFSEGISVTEEALQLQQAYLRAGIVAPKWEADLLHVALATVAGCLMIVSWNFKHIVHFRKISLYNGVNRVEGYPEIAIHTPQEVISYENQEL